MDPEAMIEKWTKNRADADKQREYVLSQLNALIGYIQACDEILKSLQGQETAPPTL